MELVTQEDIKAYWHLGLLGVFISGLFIFFISRFFIPSIFLGKELRQVAEKLKKLAGDGAVLNIEFIKNEIMDSKKLSHCWAEFAESLHGQTVKDEFGQERVARWRSTVPAEVFFNVETLIAVELRQVLPIVQTKNELN